MSFTQWVLHDLLLTLKVAEHMHFAWTQNYIGAKWKLAEDEAK